MAALSLDALSSEAYGPEAIVLAFIGARVGAVSFTLPAWATITVLLIVVVVSCRQVIAVHPDGGGAYAVAKKELSPAVSQLAAVSLAAGAAGVASATRGAKGGDRCATR